MRKREILFGCIAAVLVLITVVWPSVASVYGINKGTVSYVGLYHDGWYHIVDGEKISVEIPGNINVWGEKGNTAIYHDITEKNAGKWLLLMTSGYELRAYADNELIYTSYSMDSPKYGSVPTAANNYIEIPQTAECIALEFSCPYKNYVKRIPTIYIGDSEADLLYLNHTLYQYHHFMDLLIILYGFIVCLYTLYCCFRHEKILSNAYLGILLIVTGLWLRVGTFDVEIRRVPKEVVYCSSYQLWYSIPILLCGFVRHQLELKKRKYRILQLIFLGVAVMIQLLRNYGIAEYTETVFITHMELFVFSIVLLWDGVKMEAENRKNGRPISFQFVGMQVLIIFAGIEFIWYLISSQPTCFYIRLGIISCASLVIIDEIKKREMREKQLLESLAEQRALQLKIVMDQLQPHFTFNALGAIRLMIHMDAETAYDMIYDFSQFLRANFRAVQKEEMIPFSVELAQIRAYMNIENKRFSNDIKARYDIKTIDFVIPALTVEPLVVNAVNHGLRKSKNSGTVTVRTYQRDQYIYIEIEDDGIGMDIDRLTEISECDDSTMTSGQDFYMSFANVRRRLALQTGAKVELSSELGKGTCVRIIMPISRVTAVAMKEETR